MLTLQHISMAYQSCLVVQNVTFSLQAGEIGCLVGPSGSGKTSLLRAIAGFEPVVAGQLFLANELVSEPDLLKAPEQRQVGVVFQDYALFPHLTVAENIGFGLFKCKDAERQARIQQMLSLVGLVGMADRYIHQLSGGQQQRVALARALAPQPRLLLLDEPFSGLDADLRDSLARDIRRILQALGITAVMVTHDQHEAFAMADWIGVMSHGILQQWGTPYQLYHQPINRFVADFIGQGDFIAGQFISDCQIQTCFGVLTTQTPQLYQQGAAVELLIRPDDIVHDDHSELKAQVLSRAFRGAHMLYQLELAGQRFSCLVPSHHQHAIGEWIGIRPELDDLVIFPTVVASIAG
jgi:iron(III) transport system ATP-binding protein